MDKINIDSNSIVNENTSNYSEKNEKEKKKNDSLYANLYTSLIESLSNEKSDTDKIKALIRLEQDIPMIIDKSKLLHIFRIFENFLNDTDCLNSNILKGQILMTATTILILLNSKEKYSQIFLNFVDNILIEHIKNTNNYANIYLRQVSCQCLEELENEYPGLLFALMGKKTIDILELNDYSKDDDKSVSSKSKFSVKLNKNEMAAFENYGLYNLIEEEVFYVFQNYLSLYTTIFKHLISYYFFEYILKENLTNETSQGFNLYPVNQSSSEGDLSDFPILEQETEDLIKGNKSNKNNNSGFSTNILNILNTINPYLKKLHPFGNSNSNSNKNSKRINKQDENINKNVISNNNFSSFFQANLEKKSDNILHINNNNTGLKFNYIFEKINSEDVDAIPNPEMKISSPFLSYINKALSQVIHLLPKTSEMNQTKICRSLKFIISRIEINHNALLPFFSYFHLNSNSAILTLTAIKIVENFKSSLNENFILKLVLKLCLLVNDSRLNKALRILAIRWLLKLRFSNYNFNFNKHMTIFSYYLCPFPFDNVALSLEKLKTLYLFYEKISEKEGEFIIRNISIMDNYKYFPIFSNYVKSLFKIYFFIILRFPYKKFIKKLCEILRNNLKEVPRILPNMINLLRTIKCLSDTNKISLDLNLFEEGAEFQKMTFGEIHKYLLIKFSKFIAKFNSHTKLNRYFELFIEIAKEDSIHPQNIIIGLRNLHNAIQEMRNWKIEKNILEVCKYLLKHHDLEIMKQNKINDLLYDIHIKSFDYGIRDKAKLYYKLVSNVEKPILKTFLESNIIQEKNKNYFIHNEKNAYEYFDFGYHLQSLLHLDLSKVERFKAKIEDGGSAIFDKNFKQNVILLSDCNNNHIKYSDYVYKLLIDNQEISSKELNDLINTEEINKIISNIITPSDILRLYINDDMIDDTHDAQIDPKKIFQYDREFILSSHEDSKINSEKSLGTQHILIDNLEKISKIIVDYNDDELKLLNKFLDDYFSMINNNKFYIKLPVNIYMKKIDKKDNTTNDIVNQLEKIQKIYSINLCFGKMNHLDIKGPILLPYLEIINQEEPEHKTVEKSSKQDDLKFPYFYKIHLIVYPTYPIPSDVEVMGIFYDVHGSCFTGMLNSIKINFEDFFLPIYVPPQYKNTYESESGKIKLRETLFKKLWKQFKINDINFKEFVNTCRMMDFNKEAMIKLVFARLGPFLINENFLKFDYVVNNPYEDGNSSIESNKLDTLKVKNYYDSIKEEFTTISYNFIMDEFLEKNSEKSYFAKNNVLRASRYHLAQVIIFVPEKFHILLKIKISEFSSIIEIRSDCLKIIEYLDEYFDTWVSNSKHNLFS